ncbi:endolytic transglycosylase MltG [Phenylobacterium soli]|uniref:Endolytic murein transglycosylase n=2 Tax=Phenylobacterium soli TaxID=2170551 RepID=A0A328ATR5_9CAUL|nr:endolytic transglycosylase MltG [Phenylobacterium soli]
MILGALWLAPGPKARGGAEATTVMLDRGVRLPQMADRLKAAGVIRSKLAFMLMAKLGGGSLKAGEYAFKSRENLAGVVGDLKAGRVVRHFVTIPEGWTSAMAAEAVNSSPVLTGQAPAPPEGTLLPETYEVRRGDDRAKVIERMHDAQAALLADLWPKRRPDLPFKTPEEAVTLASIVEKETGVAAERPRIAAVFVNRLKSGMRLESDPTVIYGVAKAPSLGRAITITDLATPTPYNTYQIAGLPPTPIANPGKAAIAAVLNPPVTTELFFVADGTGGHVFASSFAEHQKNVAHWRQVEKQRAAQGTGK